ncbi:unnamed protein product [Durusdinium trenchii]|uniref:Uncharacterized protein n=2 Tax=Durusdinium trenchii TaxID=1381693 RepID=A0ABP0JCW8_9DINO
MESLGTTCFAALRRLRHLVLARLSGCSASCEDEPCKLCPSAKAQRKDMWKEAQQMAQGILREWMEEHPGEMMPDVVLHLCHVKIKESFPLGDRSQELQAFVRYAHLDLLRVKDPPRKLRSEEDWQRLFPRYPALDNGFLVSFEPSDSLGIREALHKYGFCIVKVLTREECEKSVIAMFEEINSLRNKKGIEGPLIEVDDPSTWADKNWPSSSKFLIDSIALHPQAFANRCSREIYKAFQNIFEESRLHVSVDKWGVARGANDRPRWRVGLKPHWDVNPWQCLRDLEMGNPGYQGVVALRDHDLETGCHLTLPGCAHFLKQWSLERKLEKVSKSMKSFRAAEDDPILRYMQPVPLQQGEMVIWSVAQLHGSTHNKSDKMRLTQYIRMFPAKEAEWNINYDDRDGFSCTRVLPKCLRAGDLDHSQLESLDHFSRQLLGLEPWA